MGFAPIETSTPFHSAPITIKFGTADFDDLEDVAQVLQHAERGEQQRADRNGGRLPPRSQSVALAARMGLMGNGLPLEPAGVHASRPERPALWTAQDFEKQKKPVFGSKVGSLVGCQPRADQTANADT